MCVNVGLLIPLTQGPFFGGTTVVMNIYMSACICFMVAHVIGLDKSLEEMQSVHKGSLPS